MKRSSWLIALCIAATALTTTGCVSLKEWRAEALQRNLLAKCPETLPAPTGKTGADWLVLAKDWSSQYRECAVRYNGLVEILEKGPAR